MSTTYPWTTTLQVTLPSAADGVSVIPSGSSGVSSAWVTVVASAPSSGYLTGVSYIGTSDIHEFNTWVEIDVGVGAAASEVVIATLRGSIGVLGVLDQGQWLPCPILIAGIVSGTRVATRIRIGNTSTVEWIVSLTYLPTGFTGENLLTTTQPSQVYPPATSNVLLPTSGVTWASGAWATVAASAAADLIIVAYNIGIAGNHDMAAEVDVGVGAAGFEVVIDTLRVFGVAGGTGNIPRWNPLDHVPMGSRLAARMRSDTVFPYLTRQVQIAVTYHEKPL